MIISAVSTAIFIVPDIRYKQGKREGVTKLGKTGDIIYGGPPLMLYPYACLLALKRKHHNSPSPHSMTKR